MIRNPAAVLRKGRMEMGAQSGYRTAQHAHCPGCRAAAQWKVKWPPHPMYTVLLRKLCHRIEHRRHEVRMLVRVEMSGANSCADDSLDLGFQFIIDANSAQHERLKQLANTLRQR